MVFVIMNALSEDLRKRVMAYVDSGHTYKEASYYFSVSATSVYRWSKLRKATGSLKAILVPRSPHKLFDSDLLEYIKKHQDVYLSDIANHFVCAKSSV